MHLQGSRHGHRHERRHDSHRDRHYRRRRRSRSSTRSSTSSAASSCSPTRKHDRDRKSTSSRTNQHVRSKSSLSRHRKDKSSTSHNTTRRDSSSNSTRSRHSGVKPSEEPTIVKDASPVEIGDVLVDRKEEAQPINDINSVQINLETQSEPPLVEKPLPNEPSTLIEPVVDTLNAPDLLTSLEASQLTRVDFKQECEEEFATMNTGNTLEPPKHDKENVNKIIVFF